MSVSPKRVDWVECIELPGTVGFVTRVSKDGSWADVKWSGWSKRMRCAALRVLHTIPLGSGVTVTDMTREQEMRP